MQLDDLDEACFSRYLYTAGQPDPDLLIRPSGEMRVSNFLLWQIAYSEFWVTNILWPDFKKEHLWQANPNHLIACFLFAHPHKRLLLPE